MAPSGARVAVRIPVRPCVFAYHCCIGSKSGNVLVTVEIDGLVGQLWIAELGDQSLTELVGQVDVEWPEIATERRVSKEKRQHCTASVGWSGALPCLASRSDRPRSRSAPRSPRRSVSSLQCLIDAEEVRVRRVDRSSRERAEVQTIWTERQPQNTARERKKDREQTHLAT